MSLPHILTFKIMSFQSKKCIFTITFNFISLITATEVNNPFIPNLLWMTLVYPLPIFQTEFCCLTNFEIILIRLILMGFRTHYPKVWNLGILNMLNWRNLRHSVCKKNLWPFPEIGHWPSGERYPSPLPREKKLPHLWRWRDGKKSELVWLAVFPPVYHYT